MTDWKHTPRPARSVSLALILLAGAACRILPLTDNRFHPDEALFAALARLIASGRDPLLSNTLLLVDKPPLFYYTLSLSVMTFGGGEISQRLPGLIMSILTMALVTRLAWRLWHSWTATLLTAIVVALSPFAILFSPTVFSDPQYVFWIVFAAVCASERRFAWAGLLSGLAVASKQSATFFIPLIALVGMVAYMHPGLSWRSGPLAAVRFAAGLGVILLVVGIWDQARSPAISFLSAAVDANNPGRLIRSAEVWPRASAWLAWATVIGGGWPANVLIAIGALCAAPLEIARHRYARRAVYTMLIAATLIAYLAAIWFVAFPLFDRYLLPVVYLVGLLFGRGAQLAIQALARYIKSIRVRSLLAGASALALLAAFVPSSIRASHGDYPVGGDHGRYQGLDNVAEYLSDQPMGTVVYSHDLSWHLEYYLFDAYVYRAYFLAPGPLANDLKASGGQPQARYIALASTESPTEIQKAVAEAGYALIPVELPGSSPIQLFKLERIY